MMDKLISQQAAIDVIKKRLFETAFNNVGIKQNIDETLEDVAENRLKIWFNEVPTIQPKGTRLSTVCLLCKKPAVTFNTEDDIPYTNYSYCEDCLRKGLKLLREQKKNSQAQPERKDALEKAVAVEAISDELMSRFDVSATYAYEVAEKAMNRIEEMAKEIGKR